MKNMKLAMKIGMGFGILLLLTMCVSLFSWRGLTTLDQGVSDFRGIAQQTNLIGRIQANMLMAQVSVKNFLISGMENDSKRYKDFIEKSKGFMATAGQSVKNPDLAQKLTLVNEKIVTYDATFTKIVVIKVELEKLVTDLDKLGGAMEQALTDLMDKAAKTGTVHWKAAARKKSRLALRIKGIANNPSVK